MKLLLITIVFCAVAFPSVAQTHDATLPDRAREAMKQAAYYFATDVAVNGGYVYHYSADLKERWGEDEATASQIWVQPPGTPNTWRRFPTDL